MLDLSTDLLGFFALVLGGENAANSPDPARSLQLLV